ncbi:cyclic nucleotide-binding/CBS domain-containing protein [Caldimonas sp. KR1-144]|uniref:CBS domain-containing protein n=1 Tax=Caldimonas sp. KR1-144 TaxID=3400911 RepID=UPI003BFBE0A6
MKPTVAAVMERQICCVGMDDTVQSVQTLLVQRGFSWAPVLDPAGDIVGVISETDLARFGAASPGATDARAWQLCTYKPVCVDVAMPLQDAATLMVARRIHHLVVTEGGQTVGVVSSLDLLRGLTQG